MPRPIFNLSVVESYDSLRHFFNGQEAIDEILKKKDQVHSKTLQRINAELPFHWQVCQDLSYPLRLISAYVLTILGKWMKKLHLPLISRQLKDLSKEFRTGFNVLSIDTTAIFTLKATVNCPNLSGKEVNDHPDIPISSIPDPLVRRQFFDDDIAAGRIPLYQKQGICKGISEWFCYLYLKTKDQFKDPRQHMAALGKYFAKGGGPEATLLQSMVIDRGGLLGLRFGMDDRRGVLYSASSWKSSSPETHAETFQKFSAGVYQFFVLNHAVTYIKINDQLGFLFDPNRNIKEFHGPAQGTKLHAAIQYTYDYVEQLNTQFALKNEGIDGVYYQLVRLR